MSRRRWMTALLLLPLLAGRVEAQRLAVVGGTPSYTYGSSYMGAFSSILSTRFGGAVDIYSNLNGALPGATALFVWLQDPSRVLSATETTNLQSWVSSGQRVAIFGENYIWTAWNAQFLTALGGSDCSSTGYSNASGTPLVSNALTAGISAINTTGAPGCAAGGTDLFSNTFASLFGSQQNALALMDLNTLDGTQIPGSPDNTRWGNNVADWLYNSQVTATPEPSSLALILPGLVAFGVFARRRNDRRS